MADKYISMHKRVNGFSFANLGAFYGMADGIIAAVLSLIILDIFHSPAVVGVYSAIYYAFYMIVGLFVGEFMKVASKAKLFYWSAIAVAVMYFGMSFSVRPGTFVALDFASAIPLMLVSTLIPLFMSDFGRMHGIARLNGRYLFWLNLGYLVAPFCALAVAGVYGLRAPFAIVAAIYLVLAIYFSSFKLKQADKAPKNISFARSMRAVARNTVLYFRRPVLVRAYIVNFCSYALNALRSIYVPIMVVAAQPPETAKTTLAWVLAAGIIPYVILSEPMAWFAKKLGARNILIAAFLMFAGFAVWTLNASGDTLLWIFILWQIPGAMIEPLRDLLFFDAASGAELPRLYGVFKTSSRLPRFVVPLMAAGAIVIFGATSAAWIVAIVACVVAVLVMAAAPAKK